MNFPDDRLVQRFALVTLWYSFWYSTNDTYLLHDGWLNSTNECLWDRNDIVCSPEFTVEGLDLSEDSLSGRIPIEFLLLTQLTTVSVSNNQLTGTLPSELLLLTQISSLDFSINQLTGTFPSELGVLNQTLAQVELAGNLLTGSLPSELGILTQLTYLSLFLNKLTGSLPSELGLMTQLNLLSLSDNELMGSMPPSLCSAFIIIDCGEIVCTCCHTGAPGPLGDFCP